jgi:ubiquinone/menaquinone biosynthesis C-methylase UbiE
MENKSFDKTLDSPNQNNNHDWWEKNPMTYDWEGIRKSKEGTKEWYYLADKEFWEISKEFAHPGYPNCTPFSSLIDYKKIKGKNVLEIGCGMGAHASVFCDSGALLTAIDITQRAVDATNTRFSLFGAANAQAIRVDAEKMPFPDDYFDFVWSWGVIHHSADTEAIVREIYRVMKPGAETKVMIYNKNSTRYYLHGLYQGIFKLKFLKHRSLYAVNMTFTDGYIAKHYTKSKAKNLFEKFQDVRIKVMDSGTPSFVFGWGRLTKFFPIALLPINRFINSKFGWFLFIEAKK